MTEIVDTSPKRFGCRHCDARWGGWGQAHCTACHGTFSTVGNFDRHRKDGECLDPLAVGLQQDAGGLWRLPGTPGHPYGSEDAA
jgi:hypothetical protein